MTRSNLLIFFNKNPILEEDLMENLSLHARIKVERTRQRRFENTGS